MIRKISWKKGNKELFVDYDETKNEFTVIRNFYCYEVVTGEFKVCNTDSVLNVGQYNGIVKFNPTTIDQYLAQCVGNYLPYFDEEVGFIEDYDQLQTLKDKVSAEKFDQLSRYPRLVKREVIFNPEAARIVYSAKCVVDDKGALTVKEVLVDQTSAGFMSSRSVKEINLREHLPPEVAESLIELRKSQLNNSQNKNE